MPQSLVKNYVHIVFSTKHRVDFIDEQVEKEMFSYIAAICKDFESTALQIGGTDNHIHILCLLSRKIALMKLVQEIDYQAEGNLVTIEMTDDFPIHLFEKYQVTEV